MEMADRALAIAERHRLIELLADALGTKSAALFNLGRHREAAVLARGSLAITEETGSVRARAEALTALGVQISEDDPGEALRMFLEAADTARRGGIRALEVINLGNAAEGAIDLGRWAEADALLAELEARDLTGYITSGTSFDAAMLAALRGDPSGAGRHLEEVASRMELTELVAERTWHLRARSVVRLMRDDLDGAYEDAVTAVDADPTGMNAPMAVWVAARAALWLHDAERLRKAIEAMVPLRGRWIEVAGRSAGAGLAALEGRTEEAAAEYRRALETWAEMEAPLDLALTTIDAVTVLPEDAVPEGAVGRAEEILTRLGAQPLLRRLTVIERATPAGTA